MTLRALLLACLAPCAMAHECTIGLRLTIEPDTTVRCEYSDGSAFEGGPKWPQPPGVNLYEGALVVAGDMVTAGGSAGAGFHHLFGGSISPATVVWSTVEYTIIELRVIATGALVVRFADDEDIGGATELDVHIDGMDPETLSWTAPYFLGDEDAANLAYLAAQDGKSVAVSIAERR